MATGNFNKKNNQEYWEQRALHNTKNAWSNESKVEKALASSYQNSLAQIKKEVSDLYAQYAVDGVVDYSSVLKPLSASELNSYRVQIDSIIKRYETTGNEEFLLELKRLRDAKTLTALQSKMNQIEAELYQMGYVEQQTIEESLMGNYEHVYYASIFDAQQIIGMGVTFNKLNSKAVKVAVSYPWSGAMFSDLIWDNKKELLKELKKTVTTGIIRGESYQKMARNINNSVLGGKGYKNALRLVRTETAHVIAEATAQGYKESSLVRQYVYIATLDKRTSKVCQHLDGKVFNLEDKEIGKNAPVMHPNCRSTIAPYFDDEDLSESTRIARDTAGNNYKVSANMTFEQWFKKYVA